MTDQQPTPAGQTPAPLTPELVSAILRDPDSPYYPSRITVFCDECGAEETGEFMVREDMNREQRLAVARQHLVANAGWEHTEDGDDFCPEHAGSPVQEQPADGACTLCDVVKPDGHALGDHVLNVHPDEFCGIYHEQPCQYDRPEHVGSATEEQPAACDKCKTPFDPTDPRADSYAQHRDSPWCRRCVNRCHDTEIADHRCPICA